MPMSPHKDRNALICVDVCTCVCEHVHIETEGGNTELWSQRETILLPSSFFQEWESDTTVGKITLPWPFFVRLSQ